MLAWGHLKFRFSQTWPVFLTSCRLRELEMLLMLWAHPDAWRCLQCAAAQQHKVPCMCAVQRTCGPAFEWMQPFAGSRRWRWKHFVSSQRCGSGPCTTDKEHRDGFPPKTYLLSFCCCWVVRWLAGLSPLSSVRVRGFLDSNQRRNLVK